jgi:hypothetical protein
VIALVVPILPPRFGGALQKTLKVIDAFFNESKTWGQVCIVVTNVHPGIQQTQRDAFTESSSPKSKCVRDQIKDLLHKLYDWRGPDPEFPVFFVDSYDPHGPTEPEFIRFIQFASTRVAIRTDSMKLKPLN